MLVFGSILPTPSYLDDYFSGIALGAVAAPVVFTVCLLRRSWQRSVRASRRRREEVAAAYASEEDQTGGVVEEADVAQGGC